MGNLTFTSDMETMSNLSWSVTSAVGSGLCFLVLLVIGAVWLHPTSRPYLDRVSFRIVTIVVFANMIFAISSAVGGSVTHPGFLCGFSIFVLQFTLQFSSFLLFCIALNLQLVVLYHFNGQRMEKFYVIVSFVMSASLVVPAYAANQYGWDPLERDCWYKNDNKIQRLAWQISTQVAWTAVTALGEIVASVSVILFLLRHQARTKRVFVSTPTSSAPQVIHANSYRRIILRIFLYPLASCFVNLLSIFTVLHSTISDGIHNQADYNILLLSDFLYGGRAIVYAFLVASDPALVRGVKALYHALRGNDPDLSTGKSSTLDGVVVRIELTTIRDCLEDGQPQEMEVDTSKTKPPSGGVISESSSSSFAFEREDRNNSRVLPTLDVRRQEETRRQEEAAAFNRQL